MVKSGNLVVTLPASSAQVEWRRKRENKQNKNSKRAAHFLAGFFAVIFRLTFSVKLDWNGNSILRSSRIRFRRKYPYRGSRLETELPKTRLHIIYGKHVRVSPQQEDYSATAKKFKNLILKEVNIYFTAVIGSNIQERYWFIVGKIIQTSDYSCELRPKYN